MDLISSDRGSKTEWSDSEEVSETEQGSIRLEYRKAVTNLTHVFLNYRLH